MGKSIDKTLQIANVCILWGKYGVCQIDMYGMNI